MKDRIIEFLKAENKSSAQFAVEIGVQPSGISHILSGRNNPSLDFIIKMLEKYRYLSTDWLLFGRGKMYNDRQMLTLFDNNSPNEKMESVERKEPESPLINPETAAKSEDDGGISEKKNPSGIKRIIWFYENDEFEEFRPLR